MDYKKVAADLLSGCEENCANCEYAGDSEFECTIAQLAATAITDLLARAEAAEARAEKAERERDAAVKDLKSAVIGTIHACDYCIKNDLEDFLCDYTGLTGCHEWEWRGQKEE